MVTTLELELSEGSYYLATGMLPDSSPPRFPHPCYKVV